MKRRGKFELSLPFLQRRLRKTGRYNGDCMQVVFGRRISLPLAFQHSLRMSNLFPDLFYCHFDDFYAAGSFPDILVCCESDQAIVRPIVGTHPCGAMPESDAQHYEYRRRSVRSLVLKAVGLIVRLPEKREADRISVGVRV